MGISEKKFVDIKSGSIGTSAIGNRDLILRLFSNNEKIKTGGVYEFSSLTNVLSFFGSDSQEYKNAQWYFTFSLGTAKPSKISFGRYTDEDVKALILGDGSLEQILSNYTSITDGSFNLSIAGIDEDITGIDFSSASSLSDVANTIQTAIQNANVNTQFANATVEFIANENYFKLSSGDTGDAVISVDDALSGTNILSILGWNTNLTILSNGKSEETPIESITASANLSDNFATYWFIPALTLDELEELGNFAKASDVKYAFHVPAISVEIADILDKLKNIGGTSITKIPSTEEDYAHLLPPALFAATDYTSAGANANYMYKQANLISTVSDDIESDQLDKDKINYYGKTQSGGSDLEFYQRGKMQGLSSDIQAMNIYHNEIFFKGDIKKNLFNLLLSLKAIPANNSGKTFIKKAILQSINLCITNGVISQNKELNEIQKSAIIEITNDENAVSQVATIGWWLRIDIIDESINGNIEKVAKYTLVYSTGETINKIIGFNNLV